jgi:raffinose/stachyose/melibiose transport system substrate-binding protein
MAYNKTILEAAFALEGEGRTIESLEVVSQAEYAEVFAAVQAYYDANDMDDYTVVSMAAASGMSWVTGLHNFNGYLSAGLDYDDDSVINNLLDATPNTARLNDLANWVELLFTYADDSVLLTGGYGEQVGAFADGKAAFLHQGNWTDSSYADSDFEMGYLPHATMATGNDSIFIAAPSFYVINKNSDNIEEAKAFLNDLASTEEGHKYMVNEANMVPAFDSVTLEPSTPLSKEVLAWWRADKAYAWWQNDMPSGFGQSTLGPIYTLFARGVTGDSEGISKAEFVSQIESAIEAIETE